MSSSSDNKSLQDSLTESWIGFNQTQTAVHGDNDSLATSSPVKLTSVNSKALEKLLLDAQKESSYGSSRIESLASSRASPRSQHSPTTEQSASAEIENATSLQVEDHVLPHEEGDHLDNVNWIWDWSSRPEAVPPRLIAVALFTLFLLLALSSLQFKHPTAKRHRLSIRNTGFMRGIVFTLENLPLLIFTHACSFVLGAASMAYYLRRFSPYSTVSTTTSFGS